MSPVSAAHIHLVLCHVPFMAILFGLVWLTFGLWRGSRDIQMMALVMFVVPAILAVLLNRTGGAAMSTIKGLPELSDQVLEQHQAAAGMTLAGCFALGIMALAGLILFRSRTIPGWFGALLLACGLVVGGLVGWTANLGGQVRHSEIRLQLGN